MSKVAFKRKKRALKLSIGWLHKFLSRLFHSLLIIWWRLNRRLHLLIIGICLLSLLVWFIYIHHFALNLHKSVYDTKCNPIKHEASTYVKQILLIVGPIDMKISEQAML